MEYEKMADAELDRLVAERVFGWRWYRCSEKNPSKQTVYWFVASEAELPKHWKNRDPVDAPDENSTGNYIWASPDAFTTSPTASKALRDKMAALGWAIEYRHPIRDVHWAIFMRPDDGLIAGIGEHESEFVCIASAALRSLDDDAERADKE